MVFEPSDTKTSLYGSARSILHRLVNGRLAREPEDLSGLLGAWWVSRSDQRRHH
jgi:hypothetical protein